MDNVCKVESCDRDIYSRDICRKHYQSYGRGNSLRLKSGELTQKKLETCTFEGCDNVSSSKGICIAHKTRIDRHGTSDLALIEASRADKRFWEKVDKTGSCWNWTASLDTTGHGRFFYEGIGLKAHHYAYMREHSEILEEGQRIEHDCASDICVRPSHLRLEDDVETEENPKSARADSQSGVRGVSLHKPSGKWMGNVGHNGKVYYVGLFMDILEAEKAVIAKRIELKKDDVIICTCLKAKGIHARKKGCTRRSVREREFGPAHPCMYAACSKETTNSKYCSTQCGANSRIGKGRADLEDWIAGKVSVSDSEGRLTQAVKNHLLREANYSCTRCGWNTPNPKVGRPILCIDHIDGNWKNNFKHNLVVLCYNCHSLTTTFGGLNRGSTVSPRSVFSRKVWAEAITDEVDIDMVLKGEV